LSLIFALLQVPFVLKHQMTNDQAAED
jgi:hypothetical protein